MSASGDPLDALPAAVLADVLGRVADAGDIAACRLASRALLVASNLCPRARLCAADCVRRRGGGGQGRAGGPAFRTTAGSLASLLGAHLRSLSLDAADGQGFPDDAMWVEEGEFDEADDLHLTSGEAVAAWAATAAGPVLREVQIADYWPQACWRKAEALPLISHYYKLILDTPSLSTLKLTIEKLGATVQVDGLVSLTDLRIESLDLSYLFPVFVGSRAIRTLELELPESASQYDLLEAVNPDYLLKNAC
ncbi:hypothetical protein C2845_PM08G02750 [Panicum miliaceum]|uniref:F-box domain-containing protein n=1 Tax=Panicum miliaceum TaxID=4540 RepID=A0A3L6QZH8_PANMI|nr:hypothetical protein C2845_PM08G02750 [Panicum miliaceum]